MSRVLDANEICARALRMVGAFPLSETAPNGEVLREALFRLDMIMSENSGIRELFWLKPATLSMPIVAGQQLYVLKTALGGSFPHDGIQFPTQAELVNPQGQRTDLLIASRQKFVAIARPEETGIPRIIYLDRGADPALNTLQVWPTLPATETQDYTVELVVQTYSPNLSPSGVSGARTEDTSIVGVRQAWQRWLVLTLAIDLGTGAIYKLPETSIGRWERMAAQARVELDAFENREHDNENPVVLSYGITEYEVRASGLDAADSYTVPAGGYRGFLV